MERFIEIFQSRTFGTVFTILYIIGLYVMSKKYWRDLNNIEDKYPMYSVRMRKRDQLYTKWRINLLLLAIFGLVISCLRSI